MEAKRFKLIQQFNEDSEKCNSKVNDLFKDIAVFVNGYTVPSAEELRSLMIKHGGCYHNYYKSGSTTHIIASNLPDSKLKLIENHKIVKPDWITDSIKANKVLNYTDYLLFSNQTNKQSSLKSLFQPNTDCKNVTSCIKDATQEGFLSDFYNNSRLHHISIMGTIFKDYINDIRNNKNHCLTGREELLKNSYNKLNNFPLFLMNEKKIIMHIDMDCFFVSVGLRNNSELRGQPVAVTHSTGNNVRNRNGAIVKSEIMAYRKKYENVNKTAVTTDGDKIKKHWSTNMNGMDSFAEIASCSYEARKAGIKNGMFVGQALKLCPELKFIPYDFEAYKEVSYTLYNTVLRYTLDIEAVSCDELYADCTELLSNVSMDPMEFASILRAEIKEKTGCPCSVGFGGNRLLARLATKKAKPNGQFYLKDDDVVELMFSLPVSELPGVGGSTHFKLKSMGIKTCGDLQNTSLSTLQEQLGKKLGETLHKNSFGKDDKPLTYTHVRKSVSADINYGIRFQNETERDNFLKQLAEEVSSRLTSVKMKGRSVTLKLMVRSKDAPEETAKYLGHGVCDQVSKGITLPSATSDSNIIYREVLKIMKNLNINCKDLRGIGIQLSRLESDIKEDNKLLKFLAGNKAKPNADRNNKPSSSKMLHEEVIETYEDLSLSQIDQSFLNALPDDIQKEIVSNIKRTKSLDLNTKECRTDEQNCNIERKDDKTTLRENIDVLNDNNVSDEMKTYISPSELRLLMKQWIETEESPESRDVSMVTQYLYHLILADHLEELLIIIKSFYRYIIRNRNTDNWREAYMKIINHTQLRIGEKYNSKLFIENLFDVS
ncbi:hypothetical protein O3M35_008863 [Rhynocoris fuscipes]